MQKLAPTWPASSACRAGAGDAAAVALTVQLVLLQVIRVGGQTLQVYCFTEDQTLRGLHGGDRRSMARRHAPKAMRATQRARRWVQSLRRQHTARTPLGQRTHCCYRVKVSPLMWKRLGSDKPQQSAAARRVPSLATRSERQAAADRSRCSRLTSRRSPVRAGHRPSAHLSRTVPHSPANRIGKPRLRGHAGLCAG